MTTGALPGEHMVTRDEQIQAARMRALKQTPVLRIGDVWKMEIYGMVTILSFGSLEDEAYPWPYVRFRFEEGGMVAEIGAPAFRFGKLVTRGAGEEWDPAKVQP